MKIINKDAESYIERIEQLFNKTNQFNNSHIRYTKIALLDRIKGNQLFLLEYSDTFSSPEICSALIINKNSKILESYVLSCRFFSRGLEYVFLDQCLKKLYFKKSKLKFIIKKGRKNLPYFNFIKNITDTKMNNWNDHLESEEITGEISNLSLSKKSKSFLNLYSLLDIHD